jgi:hypothetical protein
VRGGDDAGARGHEELLFPGGMLRLKGGRVGVGPGRLEEEHLLLSSMLRLKGGGVGTRALKAGRGGRAGREGGAGARTDAPQNGDVVVRQRVLKKSSGWRPVKSTVPHPSNWLHPPPPDRIVNTVPAAVELALSQGVGADGEGGGRGGAREVGRVNGRVFVGRGLHEWKNARLIVGEWRADDTAPYQSAQGRDAVGGKGMGGEGMMMTQTVDLHVHAEDGSRTWGLWFMEPESGGSFDGVTCAYTTEGQEEILMDVWGRPWTLDSCQVR